MYNHGKNDPILWGPLQYILGGALLTTGSLITLTAEMFADFFTNSVIVYDEEYNTVDELTAVLSTNQALAKDLGKILSTEPGIVAELVAELKTDEKTHYTHFFDWLGKLITIGGTVLLSAGLSVSLHKFQENRKK